MLTLFTDGLISTGKAATLLNLSRVEFLALLRKRKVVYIDYSPQELDEDFEAVEALEIEKPQ